MSLGVHDPGREPGDSELDALARGLPDGDPGVDGVSMRGPVLFAIARSRRRRLLAWRLSGLVAFAVAGIAAATLLARLGLGRDVPVVRVAEASALTRVTQGAGRVTYDVAPRRPGERFVVETPEAEIEVRGTRFSVEVQGGETSVDVEHGRVEVREPGHGRVRAVLRGGEHTAVRRVVATAAAPTPAIEPPAPPGSPVVGAPRAPAGSEDSIGRSAAPPSGRALAHTPEAAELRLFRAAHELHFQGSDGEAALRAWNRYLAAYPHGALAEEARYNRAVCLLRLGRTGDAEGDLSALAADPGAFRAREAKLLQAASLRREGRCEEAERLLAALRHGHDEIADRAAALPPCP